MKQALLLEAGDSVAVALQDIETGESVQVIGAAVSAGPALKAGDNIPRGHKIALKPIAEAAHILKYGHSIGVAKNPIAPGAWIHEHNLSSGLHGTLSYKEPAQAYDWKRGADPRLPKTFKGYRRDDGSVGIRNEIWVIPTVGCVNKTAERIAERARKAFDVDAFAFTHPFGCSQLGDDLKDTRAVLSSLARHPNTAGVLVVSLGCESNRLEGFRKAMGTYDEKRVRFLPMQDVLDEQEEGLAMMGELAEYAKSLQRVDIPVSELVVGLKCGGSDGFSGISANPLVGRFSDLLVAAGGSTVLTEVPEMFGAETVLMERSSSHEVFDKTVHLINDFKDYFIRHGQEVYENPSPGNRDGGISTLEEKSLGCIRKAGTAPIADVIPYAAQVRNKGVTLLAGPGNDLVSTTALSAAGAHMILFTTGRGTPFGAPAPTVKISSNTPLAERKPGWIDFDAGRLLDGADFDELGIEFFKSVIEIAEGKQTKSELTGNRDIAIFKDGVTL